MDEIDGSLFIKNRHIIHTREGSYDLRSILFLHERSAGTLVSSRGAIAVEAYDKNVSLLFGIIQISDMPDVQDIEDSIGQDDLFSFFLLGYDSRLKFLDRENLASFLLHLQIQFNSIQKLFS